MILYTGKEGGLFYAFPTKMTDRAVIRELNKNLKIKREEAKREDEIHQIGTTIYSVMLRSIPVNTVVLSDGRRWDVVNGMNKKEFWLTQKELKQIRKRIYEARRS